MTTVNTKGLMLGLLAIGGLLAGGAMLNNGQAYAQTNAAVAANSDDDTVSQSNSATIKQESKIKCKATVEDNDVIGVTGANVAANDCDNTQSASVSQSNTNTDNDVQIADATACQAIALGVAANICENLFAD